jgi:acetoin utilization deacetylase AcuC-like enzyme
MNVGLVIDEVFLGHRAPADHPERPERLVAIARALRDKGGETRAKRLPIRRAKEEELGLVHTPSYITDLAREVPGRSGYLDEDTFFSPGSWEAALAAAAGAVDLARAVVDGSLRRGLAVVRPPGHHAEPDHAMGFCLFNNVAIAAAAARAAGCARVAVMDWDVHHGNGTQTAFWRDPTVMYLSTHQYPFYPGTGAATDIGGGPGEGTTVNVPLPAGSGDAEYAAAFDEVIVPALRAFRPDILLVSAGYDAFVDDPLADMRVSVAGYRRMAATLAAVTEEACDGRLVVVLEGGYDLDGLGACAASTFELMLEERAPMVGAQPPAHPAALRNIAATKRALAAHWKGFG